MVIYNKIMKKDKKGFTLIELLLCIGIIAALGIIVGISSNNIIEKAKIKEYKETMLEVFNAASIYTEMSYSKCGSNFSTCEIKLSELVEKGLVDKNIYNKNNPVYANSVSFSTNDSFTVTKTRGLKDVIYYCNATNYIKLSIIDDAKWGGC